MTTPAISRPTFIAATREQRGSGILGWTSFIIADSVRVDGVAVRRTAAGRLALSWPARRDRAGIDHPYVRPIDDTTRRQLEDAILRALGLAPAEGQP